MDIDDGRISSGFKSGGSSLGQPLPDSFANAFERSITSRSGGRRYLSAVLSVKTS